MAAVAAKLLSNGDLLDELRRRLNEGSSGGVMGMSDEKEKLYIAQIQSLRASLDTEIAARQALQQQLNEARDKLAKAGIQMNQKPVVTSGPVQQSTSQAMKLPTAPSGGISPRSKSPAEALKPLTQPSVGVIFDKLKDGVQDMKGGFEKLGRSVEQAGHKVLPGGTLSIVGNGSTLDKLSNLFSGAGGNYASVGNQVANADSPGGMLSMDDDFDKIESPPARGGKIPQHFPANVGSSQQAVKPASDNVDFFASSQPAAAAARPPQAAAAAKAAEQQSADLFDFFSTSAPAPATPPVHQHPKASHYHSGGSHNPHGLTVSTAGKAQSESAIDFIQNLDFGGGQQQQPQRRNASPEGGEATMMSPGGEDSGLLGGGGDKKSKSKLGGLLGGGDDWS
eukprot:tig00001366_g8387.t1